MWTVAGPFHGVAFAPDGERFFTRNTVGSWCNELGVFQASSGDLIAGPRFDELVTNGVPVVAPDGRTVVMGTEDGRLLVWDTRPW